MVAGLYDYFILLDHVLQSCSTNITESIFELDSSAHAGNVTASPEYVLSLVEKAQHTCGEFAASFVKLVNVTF